MSRTFGVRSVRQRRSLLRWMCIEEVVEYENARSITPVTFTIAYLDENHEHVDEYKEIPYNLLPVYKWIAYFK